MLNYRISLKIFPGERILESAYNVQFLPFLIEWFDRYHSLRKPLLFYTSFKIFSTYVTKVFTLQRRKNIFQNWVVLMT